MGTNPCLFNEVIRNAMRVLLGGASELLQVCHVLHERAITNA
jgi:hypothetical protein